MKKSLITIAAALALVSCSQEDLLTGLDGKGNGAVGVNTFVAQGTRGVAFNNADEFEATTNGFDLFAFESDGNQFMGTPTDGTEFAYDAGWDYADKGEIKFWQQVTEGNTVTFYAVSPANTTTLNITNDAQTIDYTVAENSADQKDLMYASTSDVDPTDETVIKNGVQINFYHALSQIVFKAKTHEDFAQYITATVSGVEIVNLSNSGTFTFADAGFDDFSTSHTPWSNVTGSANYAAEVAAEGVAVNESLDGAVAELTNSSTALLLMPQEITGATLTDNKTEPTDGGTYLKVTCKVFYKGTNDTEATQIVGQNDETADIYIPLTTTWQAGWKYIYTLVFSDDVADPVTINEDLYVGPWHEDHNDHKDLPEEQVMRYDASNDAFLIYTAEDLATVREYVNSDATYSIDEEGNITTTVATRAAIEGKYASANYILMADIDLSGYENWEPIGTETYPFYGTFNGKNKTISNLAINTTNAYQGLFGKIQGNSSASVVIENLNVEGNITADRYIGGIIGYVYNNEEQTITIENCSFNGNITSTNTEANESYEGRASTGGIIGAIDGYDGNVYIVNCQNSGSVKSSNYMLGGIVGYVSDGNIIDCKNTATVNIARNDQRYAGGIAGYANGDVNIVKCSNTGNITINRGGVGCSSWYAGGILGMTYSGSFNIIGCINTAEIMAQTYEAGIVGYSANNIISCYNTGKINDSGAFGAGYWGTIAQSVTNGSANYYGGSCTSSGKAEHYNGEAFSADDYSDEITAMNTAIQEFAQTCEDEFVKSHLTNLKYKLNEDESTKTTMPLIFE